MPARIETFDWSATRSGRYNWDELLDGTVWQFAKDEIDVKPASIVSSFSNAARKRNMKVRSAIDKDNGTVTVQAYTDAPSNS